MALLTKDAENRIVNLLLAEGLADPNLVLSIKQEAEANGKPVLSELINRQLISNDMVAHATAVIIGVPYVELKNITPPAAIREAMEKQMKAERERRESILKAEG